MHTPQYSKHTSKDLVSFTRVMGGFFLILTAYLFYRNSFAVTQAHQTLGGHWDRLAALGLCASCQHQTTLSCLDVVGLHYELHYDSGILSISFYGIALPTALFLRITGKDLLGIKAEKTSYWKQRNSPTPHKHFEKLYTVTSLKDNPKFL